MSDTKENTAPPESEPAAVSELSPILQVALKQFTRHGYDATTVRTIARDVGVTVPAIYYHFENKQALLVALLEHSMGILRSHVDSALAAAEDDPVEQLSAVVEAIALYCAYHRDIALLDAERRALTPENLQQYIADRDAVERPVRAILERGVEDGSFAAPHPDEAARAILAMLQSIAVWYHLDGPVPPDELANRYVHIALVVAEHRE